MRLGQAVLAVMWMYEFMPVARAEIGFKGEVVEGGNAKRLGYGKGCCGVEGAMEREVMSGQVERAKREFVF